MATKVVGSIGAQLDLLIKQGGTFRRRVQIKNSDETPVNVTGWTFRAHIKRKASDVNPVAIVGCSIIDAVNGIVEILLTAAQTGAMEGGLLQNDPKAVYTWDMDYVDAIGDNLPLFYGSVTVFRQVTPNA